MKNTRDAKTGARRRSLRFEPIGRIQPFEHYPGSALPIRDFRTRTEPHIEIGAFGYVKPVAQRMIRSFCRSRAKYLFLTTTCRSPEPGHGTFLGRSFVVGHITRLTCLKLRDHLTVLGRVHVVPFDARLELRALGIKSRQAFDRNRTARLLRLIYRHRNIRDRCVKEMLRLERVARKQGQPVVADKACLARKDRCELEAGCLRRRFERRARKSRTANRRRP